MRHYRICVDGKQRLTSVQKFMDGRIGVLDSATPPQKWFFPSMQIHVNITATNTNHQVLQTSRYRRSGENF